jgi:hypothetical protein
MTRITMLAAALAALLAPALALASDASADMATGKGTYLVTATHTPESCLATMDQMAKNKKLLDQVEWGCMSGDHTAYLRTKANSPEDAISKLPEPMRANAKAEKVVKLTPKQIEQFHKEKGGH